MRKGQAIETLSVLLVFAIFGLSAVMLTLLGARAYQRIAGGMAENSDLRTALTYVANRVHAGDEAGAITVANRGETELLCLAETVDGEDYLTCIYFYEGWLREFATIAGNTDFDLENGDKIAELAGFEMSLDGSLLSMQAETSGGESRTLKTALRSGKEAAGN